MMRSVFEVMNLLYVYNAEGVDADLQANEVSAGLPVNEVSVDLEPLYELLASAEDATWQYFQAQAEALAFRLRVLNTYTF